MDFTEGPQCYALARTELVLYKNRDLWQRLDLLLRSWPEESFQISKVCGHASAEDVQKGRATLMGELGNDSADVLEVAGA